MLRILKKKKLLEKVAPILTTRKNCMMDIILTFLELVSEVKSQDDQVN